jgi:protein arginine kinase activator
LANVHFAQIVNGKKIEIFLCEQCAKERGQFCMECPPEINDFLAGLMGFQKSNNSYITINKEKICPSCGMSFEEFQKTGKLGCSECYSVFEERLEPLLKRIHGNTEHHGKTPKKMEQDVNKSNVLNDLKELLNKAIQSEEYEKAAELRDEIRKLEVE